MSNECKECKNYDHYEENHDEGFSIIQYIGFVLGLIGIIFGLFIKSIPYYIVLCINVLSFLLIGYKLFINSFINIKNGEIFDENFLMLFASIASIVYSILVKDKAVEAVFLVILYSIGEFIEDRAVDKSSDKIKSLYNLKVEKTLLLSGELVDTKDVLKDSLIIVKAGERIPLDGIVVDGISSIDISSLTGESIPKLVEVGSIVYSGSINLNKVLTIKVTKVDSESTTSKILKLVDTATESKAKSVEFITKFARIYTPIVIILAILVFLIEFLIFNFMPLDALNNSLVFLVSSCPCSLVISIPLAIYAGIGKCSSYGVLVKGGNYLELLSKTSLICFDKTGTLTDGTFSVNNIVSYKDEKMLINLIVNIEKYSNHPISKARVDYFKVNDDLIIEQVEEVRGNGLIGKYNNKDLIVGNIKLMQNYGINITDEPRGTVIYCAYNNELLGYLVISDNVKEYSKELIDWLHKQNIKSYMLTGDKKEISLQIGDKLNIDKVYYELLPKDKYDILTSIINDKENNTFVVYCGDGINDAPSIKKADIGIAIGGIGHDEAMEVSDVVLLNNDIRSIKKIIKVSKFTNLIILENIILSLLVKFVVMFIGLTGIFGSYGIDIGVFADVGVCMITIINALRILRKEVK